MRDVDLGPKEVRRRNYPGKEPVFYAGGMRRLMIWFAGLALVVLLGLAIRAAYEPTLFPLIDRMVDSWFNSEPSP
jgi:hypothetical protein